MCAGRLARFFSSSVLSFDGTLHFELAESSICGTDVRMTSARNQEEAACGENARNQFSTFDSLGDNHQGIHSCAHHKENGEQFRKLQGRGLSSTLTVEFPQNSLVGHQRQQVSETQFDNFSIPQSFLVWLRVAGKKVVLQEDKEFGINEKPKGQCSVGDKSSFWHDGDERAKPTRKTAPLLEPPTHGGRSASRKKTLGGQSASGKFDRQPCKELLERYFY